jgi:hypothetical protein
MRRLALAELGASRHVLKDDCSTSFKTRWCEAPPSPRFNAGIG